MEAALREPAVADESPRKRARVAPAEAAAAACSDGSSTISILKPALAVMITPGSGSSLIGPGPAPHATTEAVAAPSPPCANCDRQADRLRELERVIAMMRQQVHELSTAGAVLCTKSASV